MVELKLEGIHKSFKNKEILKNVNVSFINGNIYGIVGENGSGKSVLLKIISGFYYPNKGKLYIDKSLISLKNDFLKDSGVLIENPKFIEDMTGFKNLKMLAKIKNKIDDEKISEWMKIFGIYNDKDKLYMDYSLGMKQKMGIMQAIMEDQKIIILDEPFNALDIKSKNTLINILRSAKENKIIIITAHYNEEIADICDYMYIMEDKQLKMI